MIGNLLLHFKVIEKLGSGGMGIVYKAQDTKLERLVALKFLPRQISGNSDYRKRFKIEAKAAATLNHHNIAIVHSIEETEDEMFIVMEFVDGIELKEKIKMAPIQTEEVINVSLQIAEGLKVAHDKGVIHRDIKASNIMLTKDGIVKIMDFGLAKIRGDTEITKLGTTLGTTYYMSPEQTKGEKIDHRTDIWSFGVLFYQMLTGEFPFKGDYDQAVFYSILNENFPPMKLYNPDISSNLEFIVQKMLKKNPNERYDNLSEFIVDLKSPASEKVIVEKKIKIDKDIPSIAILPFENVSGDEENEYFSYGLADDLMNALTKTRDLKVAAGASALTYKDTITNFKEVGQKLNVKTILEGSVEKSKYSIRIAVKLISVDDGFYIWSEQYNRVVEDIFAVQDEITFAIIEKLKVHLQRNERFAIKKRHPINCKAFSWYLRGRYFCNHRTGEGMRRGIECFEKAIDIDPDYALAYAGMADAYNVLGTYYYLPSRESYPKVIGASRKAIDLDNSLAEAHCTLGCAKYVYNWEWNEAEKSFLNGLKINPDYSFVHAGYAHFLLLLGRFDEAQKEILRALELDPIGLITTSIAGYTYFLRRDFNSAMKEFNKALDIDPDFYPLLELIAQVYEQKGMLDKALEIKKTAYVKSEMNPVALAGLGHTYALSGNKKEALEILDQLREKSKTEFVSASDFAIVYLGLNDTERIFHWLEKSFEEKAPFMCYLKVDPRFNKIRSDKKFNEMLKKVGFL